MKAAVPRLVYISYASPDAVFVKELETHLAPLARKQIIQAWHAGRVGAGQVWQHETARQLARAHVILILISPDYLAADSLYEGEMTQALRRHEQGAARVIPIRVRPVHAAGAAFTPLQDVPRSGMAVSQWADRDSAWVHIVAEISAALADLDAVVAVELPQTLAVPLDDLMPGSVLCGKYRITGELGRGGMGRVLLAERDGIGGMVAVKVLLPQFSQSPEMAHRFFNEARAVNIVRHPGLIQVFDYGQLADGSTFLVMEYLEGESLGARLRRDPLCLRAAAPQLGWQIASILGAVHARDIVHRDLKPDNVMMLPDSSHPGGERAKVLDFGIAKVAKEHSLAHGTQAGALLGTPYYMSPEQCRDSGSVTDRADVYALGVMLYQFLSGRLPFSGTNLVEVVTRQLLEAPLPLAQAAPGVDAHLAELVRQMLDKEPLQRPAMAQVADALISPGPRETSRRRPSRRLLLSGAIALAVGLVASLWWHRPIRGSGTPATVGAPDLSARPPPQDLRPPVDRAAPERGEDDPPPVYEQR